MRSTKLRVVSALLALGLVGAACGSDDGSTISSGSSAETASTQTESSGTSTTGDGEASDGNVTITPVSLTEEMAAASTSDNGNLTTEAVASTAPMFNAGDLAMDSLMCGVFNSKTEAEAWFNATLIFAEQNDLPFDVVLNRGVNGDAPRLEEARMSYFEMAPEAAANMMRRINNNDPALGRAFLGDLVNAVYGDNAWNISTPVLSMQRLETLLYATLIEKPVSFRTTSCNNDVPVNDENFRRVTPAGEVRVSNDDVEGKTWAITQVVLPSWFNNLPSEARNGATLKQVIDQNGDMAYVVTRADGNEVRVSIRSSQSVPVIVSDDNLDVSERELVIVEGVFSAICGNLMLPLVAPEEKVVETTAPPVVTQPPPPGTPPPGTNPPVTHPPVTHPPTTEPPTTEPPTTEPPTTEPPTTEPPVTTVPEGGKDADRQPPVPAPPPITVAPAPSPTEPVPAAPQEPPTNTAPPQGTPDTEDGEGENTTDNGVVIPPTTVAAPVPPPIPPTGDDGPVTGDVGGRD